MSKLRERSDMIQAQIAGSSGYISDLRQWLMNGEIARGHRRGVPIEIRPGEMIIDGPQFVRRCLARIDAGEPGPNTHERLESYHGWLIVLMEREAAA